MSSRREFISLLGGAAAWPVAVQAQHGERVPRIGVLVGFAENDPLAEAHIATFRQGLQELGWREGTIRNDVRFAGADPDRMRAYATELVGTAPDVILAQDYTGHGSTVARNAKNPDRVRHRFGPGR